MNPADVALLVSKGFSFVCATCDKYWEARAKGLDGCMASYKGNTCAGPLKGKSFPEYSGPMKDHLNQACFVCGQEPDAIALTEDGGSVGVCHKHMKVLESYSVGSDRPPFLSKTKGHVLK